jgi:hypothetical protein
VYLAALSLGASATMNDALAAFSGEDRYVVDYVRSEFLAGLAPADVRFLTETAILDRLCGPLCDAVLQTTGSALKLEEVERSNLNVVPLDRTREWYRYHHLFRDALHSELVRREEPHCDSANMVPHALRLSVLRERSRLARYDLATARSHFPVGRGLVRSRPKRPNRSGDATKDAAPSLQTGLDDDELCRSITMVIPIG